MAAPAVPVQHRHRKTYQMALIADAHHRALERFNVRHNTHEASEMENTNTLTDPQLGVLAAGLDSDNARLPKGNFTKRLFDDGLIIRTIDKCYKTTDKGRGQYERSKALQAAAVDIDIALQEFSDSVINRDDPALQREIDTEAKRWQGIAEDRLKKINDLNKSLDEMGQVADQQQARIRQLEAIADPDQLRVIRMWMEEDNADLITIAAYVENLRQRANTASSDAPSNIDQERYQQLLRMVAVIDEWMNEDEAEVTLIHYVQHLREGFRNETAIVNDINEMAAADSKGEMDPREYVEWLRNRLVNIQTIDETDISRLTTLLEQREIQIESLNRCLDDYRNQLEARVIAPARMAAAMEALQILDELSDLIPEAGDYRTAREAINRRNARKP